MIPPMPAPALAWDGERWAPVEAPACGETIRPVPHRLFQCDKPQDHEDAHREVSDLHVEHHTFLWCQTCDSYQDGVLCEFVAHQLAHIAVAEA